MDLSNWDLDYMIPKGTSHNSLPNSTYEVPKGTGKTELEPSLLRMSAWKNIKNITQDSHNICKYFDIGPPEPDNKSLHKAVHVKIPFEGTNLPNQ